MFLGLAWYWWLVCSAPQKLDKNKAVKLFKQPKGLVVCEEQAASPLALP